MGEPAGVGPEITIKAWRQLNGLAGLAFCVLADPDIFRQLDPGLPLALLDDPADTAKAFPHALPVLPLHAGRAMPGKPSPVTAKTVIESIATAVELAKSSRVSAVVTNPIQKSVLMNAGFRHPGHTEFIAELCGVTAPIMMLAIPGLRVVPLTVHMPLSQVPEKLSGSLIVESGLKVAAALSRDFGIARPRLAVAGLNPHAGEDGKLGREEQDHIIPAVAALCAQGVDARGPYPPDSLFSAANRQTYDAALCMYHDQALIPLKALDFEHGVNITLGLPIVRTSPDHGTALDIAGQNKASPESLMAAIEMAAAMASARRATV
jgi:4-hydroxythreonine-4-phosphate dehydrogenase